MVCAKSNKTRVTQTDNQTDNSGEELTWGMTQLTPVKKAIPNNLKTAIYMPKRRGFKYLCDFAINLNNVGRRVHILYKNPCNHGKI